MVDVIEKQDLADFATTSFLESTHRFVRLRTPPLIKCLNLLIYILNKNYDPYGSVNAFSKPTLLHQNPCNKTI